jgi:hypothetical protein
LKGLEDHLSVQSDEMVPDALAGHFFRLQVRDVKFIPVGNLSVFGDSEDLSSFRIEEVLNPLVFEDEQWGGWRSDRQCTSRDGRKRHETHEHRQCVNHGEHLPVLDVGGRLMPHDALIDPGHAGSSWEGRQAPGKPGRPCSHELPASILA